MTNTDPLEELQNTDSNQDDSDAERNYKRFAKIAFGVLSVLAFFYFTRPLWHFAAYNIWKYSGVVLNIVVGLFIAASVGAYRREIYSRMDGIGITSGKLKWLIVNFVIVSALLFAFTSPIAADAYTDEHLGKQTVEMAEIREAPPDMSNKHPQLMSHRAGADYTRGSLQTSVYKPVDSDPVVINNTTRISYSLGPDSLYNQLQKKQYGAAFANMETTGKDVTKVNSSMKYGQNMAVVDGIRWRLHSTGQYLVTYPDVRRTVHNGELYLYSPVVGLNPTVKVQPFDDAGGILSLVVYPQIVMVPEQKGVAVVESNGATDHMSLQQANQHPALKDGAPLRSEQMVRMRVKAVKYQHGILNVHTSQKDVHQVYNARDSEIEPPHYQRIPGGEGKYIVATSPAGDTSGMKSIWVADVDTREFKAWYPNESEDPYSVQRAANKVQNKQVEYTFTNYDVVEYRTDVIDGQLFLQFRLVPERGHGEGLTEIVYVNTAGGVTLKDSKAKVKAFMAGNIEESGTNETQSSRTPKMIVKKVNENGTVVGTMKVYENETVVVEQAE